MSLSMKLHFCLSLCHRVQIEICPDNFKMSIINGNSVICTTLCIHYAACDMNTLTFNLGENCDNFMI